MLLHLSYIFCHMRRNYKYDFLQVNTAQSLNLYTYEQHIRSKDLAIRLCMYGAAYCAELLHICDL